MACKEIDRFDFQIDYDESADVLYASIGKPKKAISKEFHSGDFIRLDPFTNTIVGITILDFKDRYDPNYHKKDNTTAIKIIKQILNEFSVDCSYQ